MNLIGKYNFTLQNENVDFTGRATMKTIAGIVLRCATKNAKENGFGVDLLLNSSITWVLARMNISMETLPTNEQELCVETWISNIYDITTERKFVFYVNGELIGTASTMWAVLDTNTRKVVELSKINAINPCIVERDFDIEDSDRVRCANSVEIEKRTVKYSDLDINNHVNSLKYIEWVLDTIPIEQHRDDPFHGMLINYQYEVLYGSDASIRKNEKKEHHYDIYNSDDINTTKIKFTTA